MPFSMFTNNLWTKEFSDDEETIKDLNLGLCSLMTPALIKAIRCHDHTFLNFQITRSDIRSYIKRAVSLVIVYGPFNLPWGFMWAYMS